MTKHITPIGLFRGKITNYTFGKSVAKTTLICIALVFSVLNGYSQTTLYTTDFGTGASLPAGWVADPANDAGAIAASNTYTSSGYTDPNASGSGNLLAYDDPTFGFFNQEIIVLNTGALSTVGFANIKVKWGGMATSGGGFPGYALEWSTDGVVWNSISFTDTPLAMSDDTWYTISEMTLPSGAEGVANLQFRFTFPAFNSGDYYALDDFRVTGLPTNSFYSKSTGNLDVLTNWGDQTDGSGTNPTDFVTDGYTYYIRNNATPTIGANWTVSGTGSKVVVEAVSSSNFSVPSGFSFTGTIDVESGATLTLTNTVVPTLGTLGATSTVVYGAASSQTITATTYGNLTASTTATVAIAHVLGGNVVVGGILNIVGTTGPARITIGANTLTMNGTIAGTGTLTGSTTSNIVIGGTGALGTLNFTSGAARSNNLTINRTSSGTATLGGITFTVSGALALTNGTLNLTSSLVLSSTVSQSNGTITYISGTPTVLYNQGSNGQFVASGNYYTLQFFSTRDKTLASANPINIFNAFILGTGVYTATGTTIDFNGTGAETIPAFPYGNLTSSSTGTRTLASTNTITISGVFTIGTNAYTVTGSTVNFNGTVSQTIPAFNFNNLASSSTGARTLASSGTIGVAGAFTPGSNSYTNTGSTINFNGSSASTIPAFNFNNLTSSSTGGRILASSGTIGVFSTFTPGANSYTVTGSTVNFNGTVSQSIPAFNFNTLTISQARTTNSVTLVNSGTIGIAGNFLPTATFSSGAYVITNNTIDFNGTGASVVPAFNYHNLTLSNSRTVNNITLVSGGTIGVAGNMVASASFTTGNYDVTNNTVDFNGTGSSSIPVFNFNNLTSSSSGARTLASSGTIGVASAFTPGTNVYTITGSTVNFNGTGSSSIPAFNFNNLTSSSTGARTLPSSGDIGVAGLFTPGSNVYTITGSTINFNGSIAQTMPAFAFDNIKHSNAAGVSLTGNVTLKNLITISAGTLTTTGFSFTLLSDASGTARVGEITGSGDITGNISMERFFNSSTYDWRFLSSAVSGATLADWTDDFPTSGFTGATCGPSDCASPGCAATCTYVSVYSYDETVGGDLDQGYVAATDITNTIASDKGYWVYMGTGAIKFTVTNPPNKFAKPLAVSYTSNFSVSDDGWNLVSNPYPCAIDWDDADWTKSSTIDNAVYIYNATTGTYATYISGAPVNGGSQYIASQQAFWVKANGTSPAPSLIAAEGVKSATATPTYLRTNNEPNTSYYPSTFKDFPVQPYANNVANSLKLVAKQGTNADELLIRFKQNATTGFDSKYDAWKLLNPNTAVQNFSSVINGSTDLAINSNPPLTTDVHIPIRLTVPVTGTYSISRDSVLMLPLSSCLILEDTKTGGMIDLRSVITYTFTISDTTVFPRFILHIYPGIEKSSVDLTCAGSGNGKAVATGTGAGPWNYVWKDSTGTILQTTTGSSVTDTLFNCIPGTYSVTINSATCGSVTDTIIVRSPAPLIASPSSANVNCFGGNNGFASIALTGGTPGYSYLWSGGQTTSSISALTIGDYTVTSTDSKNCPTTTVISITQPSVLANTLSQTSVSCFSGANGSATATGNGGSPAYTYLWNGGLTSASISNLTAGNYTVTTTDSKGCTTISTISVTSPTAITNSVTINNALCFGQANGSISLSTSGGSSPYSFQWSSGGTTSTIANLSAGNYSVTITDNNGCSYAATGTVTQPGVLTAGFTASTYTIDLAVSNTATFTNTSVGATSYQWNFGDGSNTTVTNPVHSFTATGTYTVTLISSEAPCVDSIKQSIVVVNSPPTSASNTINSNSINVVYENGDVYLQFNLAAETNVNIKVYNMIGEIVSAQENLFVKHGKVKLEIPTSAIGIYIAVSEFIDTKISKKIIIPIR